MTIERVFQQSISSMIKKIVQIGIVVLLIFTPLAFGSVEIWAKSALGMATFGLVSTWLIRYGFGREMLVRFPGPLLVMVALFAGWILIQQIASASIYYHGTRDALVLGLAYVAIFGLVALAFRTEKEINRILLALIVIGFGVALFAILQKYTWNGKMYWVREVRENGAVFGPFVNRNHFAGYMEMLIPVAIGYTVAAFAGLPTKGRTAWRRFIDRLTSEEANKLTLLLFMMLVMSVSLVLSLSRTGILSFLTAMVLIGMILLLGRATKRWVLLPGILITALLISLTWFGLGPIIERLQTLLHITKDTSMLGRIEVWKDTTRLVSDYPVMGTGLGTFEVTYPAYKTVPDQVSYEHTHNDYLQLLSETGWVGFALGMGIIGMILGLIVRGWRRRQNPWARAMLMGLFTGILALLIHGFTDFNFHIPANAVLFAGLLGLAWNLSQPERSKTASEAVFSRWRPARAMAGLAVIGWLFYTTAVGFAADSYYRSGLKLEKAGQYEQVREKYRQAIAWDPAHPTYHFALAKIHERDWAHHSRSSSLQLAEEELQMAIEQSPTIAEYHLHLGWVYAQQKRGEKATAEFAKVLKLDPTNANWRHYVGLWFAGIGEKEKALSQAQALKHLRYEGKAKEIEARL